ncbi:hypothetical protein DEIPH_ctg002orf0119 [Deinococcus phoenicis]|uniref:Uncharacterized protein n=1 Tax=Deinococcus phoenicis TaxID=1476583 RepID=A0A016QUW1_9DEIO|nr:hypothetical protein DEIPH_ctg002orf0119 [Deinococcus phoenicis]
MRYGSSPPTWGTRLAQEDERHVLRFIPTHVGNTLRRLRCARCQAVHPHPRGEHPHPPVEFREQRGSSPPTWGTPTQTPDTVLAGRFIPTHVGNTSSPITSPDE